MLEHEIEDTVVGLAERAGWEVRKAKWQIRGAPDRVFFGFDRCVFIEFKRPGEVPVGQQKREIARLQKAYGEVYWTDSIDEAKTILGL